MIRYFAVALLAAVLAPGPASAGGKPPGKAHHGAHGHHGHQHGMHKRFKDPKRWAKRFDSKRRDKWQKPAAVLAALGLKPKMTVADIGASTGYFAVRFARALKQGTVYGVDIEPAMVRYLARRAKRAKLGNVRAVLGAPSDPKIPVPVDLIFVCNTYHHISARTDYFRRLLSKLRSGGRLVIVDFKRGPTPVGPPQRHRIAPARLDRELSPAGYQRVRLDEKALPYQYIAVYRPRRDSNTR